MSFSAGMSTLNFGTNGFLPTMVHSIAGPPPARAICKTRIEKRLGYLALGWHSISILLLLCAIIILERIGSVAGFMRQMGTWPDPCEDLH